METLILMSPFILAAVAALLGTVYDRRHRFQTHLFARSKRRRAETMARYFNDVHDSTTG